MKRVYLHTVQPEHYPEFTRRAAKAVTEKALEYKTQFTTIRGFSHQKTDSKGWDGAPPIYRGFRLTNIREQIDLMVEKFGLGKVLWPVYGTLFADNFNELVDVCREKGLYLYDFWGYLPGSNGVKDMWSEYSIPDEVDSYMQENLGDHFLGYDNGEQDGRYVHAFAQVSLPYLKDRKAQYKNFQGYFEHLNEAMRNHTVTLASLTYLHYFAKEGNTIMLGAETAQALPSNPMWFSVIRGASRQYGLLTFGNASVWNRFGFKNYAHMVEEPIQEYGVESCYMAGTSLSLLRRLIYNQYMYNCRVLGFENGWEQSRPYKEGETLGEDEVLSQGSVYSLTPIGYIQRNCARFTEKYPDPGVLYTPVAFITDFFAGWMPPRHLYTGNIYRVWGNVPYAEGDYELDRLFDMVYPGYENSGFYRDERGFMTPTPYGEIADLLLSDVRSEVLSHYAVAVIVNGTAIDAEFYDKLVKYVTGGGHAIITRENIGNVKDTEGLFDLPAGRIVSKQFGKGEITVITGGVLEETGCDMTLKNDANEDIPHPYRMKDDVREYLGKVFNDLRIVSVDNERLQFTLDIKNKNEYTIFVSNNTLKAEKFNIIGSGMKIVSVEKLDTFDGSEEQKEYYPRLTEVGTEEAVGEGEYELKPYCCAIYAVRTEDADLEELPETDPVARDDDLYLALDFSGIPAKDYLLAHPTFLHHFGGMMLPAEYLDRMTDEAAEKEGRYFRLQNVKVIVDFSRMLNQIPDLSVIGNFPERAAESEKRMENILDKASYYGCEGGVVIFTRSAENEYDYEVARDFSTALYRRLADKAAEKGMKLWLTYRDQLADLEGHLTACKDSKLGFAFDTSFGAGYPDYDLEGASLLLLSASEKDGFGQDYFVRSKISGSADEEKLIGKYKKAKEAGIPVVLSAVYEDWDEIYDDIKLLK